MQESGANETAALSAANDWRSEVFETQQAALVAYVKHLLGDLETARDVVQDAFLRLWEADARLVRDHVLPWLFTVCRRRALDLLRKDRRMHALDEAELESLPAADPGPDLAADRRDAADRAGHFLRRLPPNQREVLLLKFQSSLSYREISEVTGLSVSNVGFLIHTALKRLRHRLTEEPALASQATRRTP